MLLGFKSQFVPFVREGSKTHTIRAFRRNRPRVGQSCDCYENVRQKSMALLGRWPCVRVEEISIEHQPGNQSVMPLLIRVDGCLLYRDEALAFAWRDGFRPALQESALTIMAAFWKKTYGEGRFDGHLIHWDFARRIER